MSLSYQECDKNKVLINIFNQIKFKYMTKLEQAIQSVPYSTDWFKMRTNVANLVADCIENAEWQHAYRTSLDTKNFIQFIVFKSDGNIFVWSDFYEDGKIEGSQLEYAINEYAAHIIYSHNQNSIPMSPMMFKLIDENQLYNWD
jgi:hypothetical protein